MAYWARDDDLMVRTVGEETVVYDRKNDTFLRLNAPASVAWRHCQEGVTLAELAQALHDELDLPLDEELAKLALSELMDAALVKSDADDIPLPSLQSRRTVMKRIAAGSMIAVMFPVVESMVAPKPAFALSY